MSNGLSRPEPTRNEKRRAAREKAQSARLEQKKKERRNRLLIQGGVAVGVVAIAAATVIGIVSAIPKTSPGPLNMLSDGIRIGAGAQAEITPALQPGASPVASELTEDPDVVDIVMYVDYLCSGCGEFEDANAEQIETWVSSGAATLEVHPVAFLDRLSLGSQYSTRAANAAACVANYSPNNFLEFHGLLFDKQPEEGTTGLDDEELVDLAERAGVTTISSVEQCIDEVRFKKWVNAATARAFEGPLPNADIDAVTRTPTVIVNGFAYPAEDLGDASDFAKFVSTASGNAFSDTLKATPSPSPSPSAAPAS
ncbi:DsbA family protein [Salinibacterium sp. SYSU T00001]|uniref:DsbA family protein n=1 Tax=Homoserinimonas sedimenticola TaxID=2986805 RepID=UPI0022363F8A|nr:DsbA family protein [Salinibacterium sedimenticola]MCW4386138.1 DsbA family protein [Salinibacterium sedimenticola]